MVGASQPERVGVCAIERGHLPRELGARAILSGDGVVDLVVDVGDVDDERHPIALPPQEPREQREDDEGPRVADVNPPVDGWPARIDPHPPLIARAKRLHLPGERVVNAYLAHRRATLAVGSNFDQPSSLRLATASAAAPSPRPTKPIPSPVLAFTLTRSGERPSVAARRSRIAWR